MPRLHVCSLALIAETVDKTGARSLRHSAEPRHRGRAANRDPGRSGISIWPFPTSSSRWRVTCCPMRAISMSCWRLSAPGIASRAAAHPLFRRRQPLDRGRLYRRLCAGAERDEFAIARALRAASPTASPNAHLVALADDALGRGGRMNEAIAEIGRGQECSEGEPFTLELS